MKKHTLLVILFLLTVLSLQGKVRPVAHYHFGRSGNVTYAIAPDVISSLIGSNKLTVSGKPVFYADAPGERVLKGEGSVLFNGNGDGYIASRSNGTPEENIVFEVWVKARTIENDGDLQDRVRIVAANGNSDSGYVIAQRD
ncbi:MAG: hypothetical protein AB2L24_26405 [Mangrovibacterium sp.]